MKPITNLRMTAVKCSPSPQDKLYSFSLVEYSVAMDGGSRTELQRSDVVSPHQGLGSTGLDVTLIDEMLRLTPEQRLCYHDSVIQFIYEMRTAFEIGSHGISS
jgi:hypothetical protein